MISVVVRSKNEIRWIGQCIRAIQEQEIDIPVEIILVDNNSTDGTVAKALAICSDINVIHFTETFRPGRAINFGCRAAKGDIIVVISAHCVPADTHWLRHLVARLGQDDVVGTYGRQIPLFSSTALDKRDLWQVFRTEPRIQSKDYFFHNANSSFYKDVWEQFPFDEQTLHIEDILWCQQILKHGHKVAYEPLACVHHHHGINHHEKDGRVERTALIFETLDGAYHTTPGVLEYSHYDCIAVLPVFESEAPGLAAVEHMLKQAVANCRQSKLIKDVFVVTDSSTIGAFAQSAGAIYLPFQSTDLTHGSGYTANILEKVLHSSEISGRYPDAVALFKHQYPFAQTEQTDEILANLLMDDYDDVVVRTSSHLHRESISGGNIFTVHEISGSSTDHHGVFQEKNCVCRMIRADVAHAYDEITLKRGVVHIEELQPVISVAPDADDDLSQRPSFLKSA
jgi:rhamnosyltransferase